MAEIRKFSSGRQGTDQKKYNKKISQHKFFKRSRIGGFLIVTACIVIAVLIWENNRIYTEYVVKVEGDLSIAENADCIFLGDSILAYSMDGASCTNTEGVQVWNQMYQMQKPIIDVCQNVIAIGDYNGNNIYIMDDTKVLGNFSTGLPVKELCVSSNGLVTVILEDTDVTWIYLYDSTGEVLAQFKTTMEISGYPLAIDMSEDGTLVGISYLFMDKDAFSTNVAFYNFREVGSNYQNNMVSGYTYNSYGKIIPFFKFSNLEDSYAVGTDAIISYTSSQIPKQRAATLLEDEIVSVFYGTSNIGIVCLDDAGEKKYRLDIYDVDGKQVNSYLFDMEYKEILLEDNRFIIYNEEECQVFSMSNSLKFETTFTEPIIRLKMIRGKEKGIIVTRNRIFEFNLK